jgi:hypothetical protein
MWGGQSGCVVGFVSDSVSCRIAVDPSFDPSCSHLLDVNNQKWFRMNAVMSLRRYCRQNQSNELFIGELSTLYLVKRYVPRDVALLVLILLTRTGRTWKHHLVSRRDNHCVLPLYSLMHYSTVYNRISSILGNALFVTLLRGFYWSGVPTNKQLWWFQMCTCAPLHPKWYDWKRIGWRQQYTLEWGFNSFMTSESKTKCGYRVCHWTWLLKTDRLRNSNS